MAITTMDGLTASKKQKVRVYFPLTNTKGAGTWESLWKLAGDYGAGSTPPIGIGEQCNMSTSGAMKWSQPTSPDLSYVGRAIFTSNYAGMIVLYDRLVHTSGLVGNITTEQIVNSVALPRYTSGLELELYVETYAVTGSTPSQLTVKYTDESDNTGVTSTIAHQANPVVGQMQRIPLVTAGIKSVESVQFSVSTGTAGDFGITILKPLVEIPVEVAYTPYLLSPFETGLPQVLDNACLAIMVRASTTYTGTISGSVDIFQG